MQESSKAAFFDRLASNILIVVLGLSPIFFVPFLGFGVEIGKTYFIALGVIVALVCWIIARMVQGSISVPKTPIIAFGLLLPVAFLLSAFFSPAWKVSLSGLFANSGTVVGMTILALIFAGSALYLNSERKIITVIKIAWIATAALSFFQVIYLVAGARYLNLGTFYTAFSNTVGKWNDLAIWYGLVIVTVMLAFQFMALSRRAKMFGGILGVVSILFLVLINFTLAWAIVGFVALLIFVYSIMVLRTNEEEEYYTFPAVPFAVLILSLFFFLANPLIANFVGQKLGLAQTEIRPSVSSTTHVFWQTFKQHPILGAGPDRFANAWYLNQPKSIIYTNFWSTEFNSGSGFIPTLFTTTGLVGTLCLIIFLVLFLIAGVFHVLRPGPERRTHMYLVSAFTVAVYGWIMAVVYNPGIVGLTFAFAASGIFIGILSSSGRIPARQTYFLKDPRHSFFAIALLVILLLGSLYTLFTGGEKFVSMAMYTRAQALAAKGDLSTADDLMVKAIALYPADVYYRAHSALSLSELGKLLNNASLSKDIIKSEFQNYFTAGEASARQAISYDSTNPSNWTNLGLLYQKVLPLQIAGAYDNAKAAFAQAAKAAPHNPDIDLLQAKLEIDNKNHDGAKTIIQAALEKKPNFIAGIFLLAELEAADGDSTTAIKQLEQVALADPRNASVFLELGVFKYDSGDFTGAVSAFERSITLDPTVLNTHYMLGLSYSKVGRVDEAKQVFAGLQKALPDNQTITKIVENLNAGKAPLDGMNSGVTPIPEKSDSTTTGDEAKTTTKPTTTKPKAK